MYTIYFRWKSIMVAYRPLLKQIKNSAESHIVLDCSTEKIYDVLKQAQQIGMMSDYHSYLITSLVRRFPIQAIYRAVIDHRQMFRIISVGFTYD